MLVSLLFSTVKIGKISTVIEAEQTVAIREDASEDGDFNALDSLPGLGDRRGARHLPMTVVDQFSLAGGRWGVWQCP